MNPRRITLTLGAAVGAAFAAALIGPANARAARADTEPDPLEDLFGDSGINSRTPSVDNFLATVAVELVTASVGHSGENWT